MVCQAELECLQDFAQVQQRLYDLVQNSFNNSQNIEQPVYHIISLVLFSIILILLAVIAVFKCIRRQTFRPRSAQYQQFDLASVVAE